MSVLSENKYALISIAVVSILILGYVITTNLSQDIETDSQNQETTSPTTSETEYALFLQANGANGVITSDEETTSITVSAYKWMEGQDRSSETPEGDPVEVSFEITTSMGYFLDTGEPKLTGTISSDGRTQVTLVGGEVKGVATVTAEALDDSGQADSVRIYIVDVTLSPAQVIINKNEVVSFEVSVDGIDDPDLVYYRWRNYVVMGYYKPMNDEIIYPTGFPSYNCPVLLWKRSDGREGVGYIEVEAFMIDSLGFETSLGKARSDIHHVEYYFDCALVGRVERTDYSTSVKYGCLIPKVDGAVGYGVRGSGFNDTLYYGETYGSGFTRVEELVEEEGGYFLSFTSWGSNTVDPRLDTELIEGIAWRFEGGLFYACPYFDRFDE